MADDPDPTALRLRARATAANIREFRRDLRRWLTLRVDDQDLVEDLCLAATEALENAVDHAFTDRPVGVMTLAADDEGPPPAVAVSVADDGAWLPPSDPGYRGRGLSLIARLTASHELQRCPRGTRLTFRHPITPDADHVQGEAAIG